MIIGIPVGIALALFLCWFVVKFRP